MNVFYPFHRGDLTRAVDTLRWNSDLGGTKAHHIILHPAKGLKEYDELREIAAQSFASCEIVPDCEGLNSWPSGPNSCMRQACTFFYMRGQEKTKRSPWIFWENDAIPLVPDWLDQLEAEYRDAKRPAMLADGRRVMSQVPFMGAFVRPVGDTPDHCSGVSILPWDAMSRAQGLMIPKLSIEGNELAFDIAAAAEILPQMSPTNRIQHMLATPDGQNPVFPNQESLNLIRPGVVLFHRNKDGSLAERLREKRGGEAVTRQAHNLENAGSNPAPATTDMELRIASDAAATRILFGDKHLPQTLAEQMRSLIQGAVKLIDGKPARKAQFQTELRTAGLIGPAKKKRSKKRK